MKKVRVGIIGAGRMGITHLSILNSDERVEVSSVADPSKIVLTGLKRHMSLKTFKDYRELIEADRPDALVVCTPPHLHYPVVKEALRHGMHVFAEKPFTLNSAHAFELANGYENAGLVHQVGYVNRFNDVFFKAAQLLGDGVIGRVIRYRSEMFSRTVTRKGDGGGWRASRESGGGVTFEMAAHAIDLVNFMKGKPDRVLGAATNRVHSEKVEDIVSATFLHTDGVTGTLFVNWSDESVRKPTNRLEFIGEGGKLLADQHSVRLHLNRPDPERGFIQGWNTLHITDVFRPVPFYVRGNEFTRQLYHFVDNILGERTNGHSSFRHAAETLEVIESIFANAEENAAAF